MIYLVPKTIFFIGLHAIKATKWLARRPKQFSIKRKLTKNDQKLTSSGVLMHDRPILQTRLTSFLAFPNLIGERKEK